MRSPSKVPLLVPLIMISLLGCADHIKRPLVPLKTVDKVDLKRYQGRWFEIAKIPNRFQSHCVTNTSSDYRLMDDGAVAVKNRCIDSQGDADEANGMARVVAPISHAQLEVSFVNLLGLQLFWGDYWILALDPDYQYALIGEPKRKYGWVLARQQQLSDPQWDVIENAMKANGYKRDRFEASPHHHREGMKE